MDGSHIAAVASIGASVIGLFFAVVRKFRRSASGKTIQIATNNQNIIVGSHLSAEDIDRILDFLTPDGATVYKYDKINPTPNGKI